ncbi:MAG: hypothetical protein R3F62_04360 [Planctomycetota bacterium]
MDPDASPERLPWIYTPWVAGLAFWLGVVGGPVVGTILGANGFAVAFVDCPLCADGTRELCAHRVFVFVLLHFATCLGLAAWWTAVRRRWAAGLPREEEPAEWWGVALGALGLLGIAVLLEQCVDVETVVATGPTLASVSAVLVSPRLRLPYRVVGGLGIAVALIGFYLVVCLELSPSEARVPLFLVGVGGLVGMLPAVGWTLWGLRARP